MKYKKLALLCLTLLLILLVVSGCKKEEPVQPEPEPEPDPNFPVVLELPEETLTIQRAPTAVVSLSSAMTELLDELDAGALLKGVASYDSEETGKRNCGTPQNVDLDMVKEIKPQILFTDTPLLSQQLTALYQMDVEVVLIPRPKTEKEILERASLTAQALYGREDGGRKAKEYEDTWQERWELLEKAGASIPEDEKIKAILLGQLDHTVATGDTFEGQILEFLGFENLGADGNHWQVDPEFLEQWDPQAIFYDSRLSKEDIIASAVYAESAAVKEDKLFPVDWTAFQRQGLAMLAEYENLMEELYPDAWEAAQPVQEEPESESATGPEQKKTEVSEDKETEE